MYRTHHRTVTNSEAFDPKYYVVRNKDSFSIEEFTTILKAINARYF